MEVDPEDLLHVIECNGRQGAVEAELHARQGDPETSHEAMEAYDPERMANAVTLVVSLYRLHGPMADYQLVDRFQAAWQRPCCDHLYRQARSVARDKGLLRDSGQRATNPTTNRRQIVWEHCDAPVPLIHRCPTCGKLTRRSTLVSVE